jgi:osmotically-inducible protein OsmY
MARKTTAFFGTLFAALGAGVMYLLDPQQGRRRRALVRDKMVHYGKRTGRVVERTSRDVANRTRGKAYVTRKRIEGEEVPDGVLVDRVRAAMGHVIDNPHDVLVSAQGGRVTLAGRVQADEVDRLLERVAAIPGVGDVENRLETAGEVH